MNAPDADLLDCPICKGCETRPFTIKEGRTLRICAGCRHIWFEQMPTPGELSAYYAAEYSGTHGQQSLQESEAAYYRAHAKELRDFVDRPFAIADVGCSIPVFLREAGDESSRRIGVELASEAHVIGKDWGIEMMSPEDFLATVPDESLDVLRYSHVLEHHIDPLETLAKQVGKVREGGLVYITQPNFPVFRPETATVDLHDSVWPSHLHFFSPLSVGVLLERVGIKLERFLTHSRERDSMRDYSPFIDFLTAADRLDGLKDITVEYGMFTGWPYYAGQNVGCFARKVAPSG